MSTVFYNPSDDTDSPARVDKIRPVRIVTYPGVEMI